MNQQSFEAGDTIFQEGDESSEAYRILSGSVEILIKTDEGLQPVANLKPGEIFGEMGIIDDKPRSATARALQAVTVEVIDESNFESYILRNPDRLREYLSTMFERLRATDVMLELALRREMNAGKPAGASATDVTPSLESAVHVMEMGPSTPAEQAEPEQAAVPAPGSKIVLWSERTGELGIDKFPFRIGRQDSSQLDPFSCNDLSLPDQQPYQVSRNHCVIERYHDGFAVRDRGSTEGTIVNGKALNVRDGQITAWLQAGENEIVLGQADSPNRFRLMVA